ncbi:hypothetical protein PR202_ga30667 [Eleusine coracana subsp. coracana]|uniref:FAD linked oxidase N-terminal domain-containing protein n=1 Tax=Eleusine coracana subsp. coracana TaxID=191504 RepID=A0AAV5DPH0_ELECO|nr:hypothetical protein PR202_ga30667 [Eleusine coracana subsp. coracana]
MTRNTVSVAALVLLCLVVAIEAATRSSSPQPATPPSNISSCLLSNGVNNFSLPGSPSYTPLLDAAIRNRRFQLPGVGKPAAVVLPSSKRDLQRSILCARASSLAIRVRSGGHSYEGLSYTTENHVPFVLGLTESDLTETSWVESTAKFANLNKVDAGNVFNNAQSIPPSHYRPTKH